MSAATLLRGSTPAPAAAGPLACYTGSSTPNTGVQLIQVEARTLPGEIEAGDLLRVDFDQHAFTRDGLYVVQIGEWMGVRRLADTLGGLRVLDLTEWRPVPASIRILGYVGAVYTAKRSCFKAASTQ